MKVKFKREGGFAGMPLQREAESQELPQPARLALDSLQSVVAEKGGNAPRRRDGFVYTFEFKTGDKPVVVALHEEHVPKEIEPLIHFFESST